MLTHAGKIIAADRTPKEKRAMCEWACASFEWPANSDTVSYTFKDGSQLIAVLDESLGFVEVIEV